MKIRYSPLPPDPSQNPSLSVLAATIPFRIKSFADHHPLALMESHSYKKQGRGGPNSPLVRAYTNETSQPYCYQFSAHSRRAQRGCGYPNLQTLQTFQRFSSQRTCRNPRNPYRFRRVHTLACTEGGVWGTPTFKPSNFPACKHSVHRRTPVYPERRGATVFVSSAYFTALCIPRGGVWCRQVAIPRSWLAYAGALPESSCLR
jgi:hypothetical protein